MPFDWGSGSRWLRWCNMSSGTLGSKSICLGRTSSRNKEMMRNTALSSKHNEELRNGRGAVCQKSKSKIYGKMQRQSKENSLV